MSYGTVSTARSYIILAEEAEDELRHGVNGAELPLCQEERSSVSGVVTLRESCPLVLECVLRAALNPPPMAVNPTPGAVNPPPVSCPLRASSRRAGT
eukprot:1193519-Prorocentrum_minimum.AAC.2